MKSFSDNLACVRNQNECSRLLLLNKITKLNSLLAVQCSKNNIAVGIKLLSSKDAKKLYTNGTAAVLRAKECVMKTATTIQENAEDIYEEAKAINEERAVKEEQEFEETQTEEITEEAVEETVAE